MVCCPINILHQEVEKFKKVIWLYNSASGFHVLYAWTCVYVSVSEGERERERDSHGKKTDVLDQEVW